MYHYQLTDDVFKKSDLGLFCEEVYPENVLAFTSQIIGGWITNFSTDLISWIKSALYLLLQLTCTSDKQEKHKKTQKAWIQRHINMEM